MKTKVFTILFSLLVIGCSSTNHIILPNGEKGLVIDCSHTQWSTCFRSAGEIYTNGYKIYERAVGEFTESKIPLTEMKVKKSLSAGFVTPAEPQQPIVVLKDKYMVISCTA